MKYLIALIAALTVIGFTVPDSASANPYCHGQRRIVSYHPCGAPIYAVYNISYFHGRQYGQWITQNRTCGCNTCAARRGGFSRGGFSGSRFGGGYSTCPPQRPVFGRSSGIFFRFGR